MREIKFRGKKVTGEWVEGCIGYGFTQRAEYIMPKMYFATRDFGEIDKGGNPIIEEDIAIGGFVPIIPETVGQFTGLTDKSGKEIFEGDILGEYYEYDNSWSYRVVTFGKSSDCRWGYFIDGLSYVCTPEAFEKMKIIGNIHDNPELIK